MTDAQTEARAIARRLEALAEHLTLQPLTHADDVDIATIREAAAALAAKNAELAAAEHMLELSKATTEAVLERAERVETELVATRQELGETRLVLEQTERNADRLAAELAEAREALASNASAFEAIRTHIDERSLPLARGLCSQGSFAARRALTGGKNG